MSGYLALLGQLPDDLPGGYGRNLHVSGRWQRLRPRGTYRILVHNFRYNGGNGYLFGEQALEGYNTGSRWRGPVIHYPASLNTSPDHPLEDYLDFALSGQ